MGSLSELPVFLLTFLVGQAAVTVNCVLDKRRTFLEPFKV
jgi:hypothetical protein